MSRIIAKPDDITTLGQWANRWGRVKNEGFDPESREPTVYEADGVTRAKSFPWVREGDVMTILSNPTRFGERAVKAAQDRYNDIHTRRGELVGQGIDSLQKAEAILVARWREYYAASKEDRAALRPSIQQAERNLQKIEAAVGKVKYAERRQYDVKSNLGKFHGAHVPAIPTVQRGLPLSVAAEP
jgi:hypothetical protein